MRDTGVPPPADGGPGWDAGPRRPGDPSSPTCARVDVGTTLATPNVLLVIDQSASMSENEFPAGSGITRWDALEGALVGARGLVTTAADELRFGLVLYHAAGGSCPALTVVPAELGSYTRIEPVYRLATARGGTPTGQSLQAVLGRLDELVTHPEDPTVIVLATDGEPDTCADTNDEEGGRALSLEAVEDAYARGIRTYVISVGEEISRTHLQQLANAGVGASAGDAPFYVATDTARLAAALGSIVSDVVSCDVRLDGEIDPAAACTGEVRLSGRALSCDDANGWHAVDATHIEIMGAACDELLAGGALSAVFPCGALVI